MKPRTYDSSERVFIGIILLSIILYIVSWQIPLMEIDAAQYANISREMLQNKHFLHIYDQGKDYLDKPPMLFWLSSLSMYVFGVSDAAYRFPSFLFSLLSIYSTFRLASLFYTRRTALVSAMILASCQALFLINHDVRTDTMLMGWVSLSLWQLAAWYKTNRWSNFLLGTVAIAGGLMTKGPIALWVPLVAFGSHFFLQRKFRMFVRPHYLLMIVIILLLLVPMCIGLYQQFDLHPEKVEYGRAGTSGLRFFFWTQSFGRITGENTFHENDSIFFLFENMLWGFLPWILFFVGGLIINISTLFVQKFRIKETQEFITTGGFLLTYLSMGMSRAQLPHYIYVVFPLAAIIAGNFLVQLCYENKYFKLERIAFITHAIIFSLIGICLIWLLVVPFPEKTKWTPYVAVLLFGILIYLLVRKKIAIPNLILLCAGVILIVNLFLDLVFYPGLLNYQQSVSANKWMKSTHIGTDSIFIYNTNHERSLDFYANHLFVETSDPANICNGCYILTDKRQMDSAGVKPLQLIWESPYFHVSKITLPFLKPASRPGETDTYVILQKK